MTTRMLPSVSFLIHKHSISPSQLSKIHPSGPKQNLLKSDILTYLSSISNKNVHFLERRFGYGIEEFLKRVAQTAEIIGVSKVLFNDVEVKLPPKPTQVTPGNKPALVGQRERGESVLKIKFDTIKGFYEGEELGDESILFVLRKSEDLYQDAYFHGLYSTLSPPPAPKSVSDSTSKANGVTKLGRGKGDVLDMLGGRKELNNIDVEVVFDTNRIKVGDAVKFIQKLQ